MSLLHLITGGSRSGKSAYAQSLAESIRSAGRTYVATCPVLDEEMRQRIERHRRDRQGRGWRTVEAPLELARAVADAPAGHVVLVDCLTLWVNNLLYQSQQGGGDLDEDDLARLAGELAAACRGRSEPVILVTNEVGMSIVPENALARRYRDLVGRCNQVLAAAAAEVTLVACGCPLNLKAQNTKPNP